MASGKIDVHLHLIPPFYRDAVYAVGAGPAIGRYPEWTPPLALDLMDQNDIALAIASVAQPGVQFFADEKAVAMARRCNEYGAELAVQWPQRFGSFGLLPMHEIDAAISEATYCLETLKLEGVCLFASYGERFLGARAFDPLMSYLDQRKAVVYVHPSLHPSSRSLALPWPGFMMEYVFDTTRAAVNLIFSGALERFPNISFILAHAGGTLPFISWRLSVAPMIDARLQKMSRQQIFAACGKFWYDTALACGPQAMGALLQVAAKDRILFGSDWPFANERVVAEEVADFSADDFLLPQQRALISYKNALALFPQRAAQFA